MIVAIVSGVGVLVGIAIVLLRRGAAFRLRMLRDLRAADEELETRVIERTASLVKAARELEAEVSARRTAQEILRIQLQRLNLLQQISLNLLQQITRAIGERQDLRSIYSSVVETLEKSFPVELCCICSYDSADSYASILSVSTQRESLMAEPALESHARVPVHESGLSACARGELVYAPDLGALASPFSRMLARAGQRSLIAAPLQAEHEVFAILICVREQPDGFSSGECEFLKQLSEHVALAARQAQLHDALRIAYDDLRQSQAAVFQQERLRALGQMASGIAHDINNAISPVILYTESLLEDEPDLSLPGRHHIEIIRRAIGDVAETIARLHEFSRQREEKGALLALDFNQLARQVIGLTQARWSDMAQQRGIVIEIRQELAEGLPVIMGVESELRDALVNLIFNAVDAMPEGGPLTLRTSLVEEAAAQGRPPLQFVRFEVTDVGVGMDEDTRRRCMEPFFTTKGERGTGLGLAMVFGTMQRHGSDIAIDSEKGRGSTFRFNFPVPSAHAIAAATPSPSRLPSLDILLVDDDPLVSAAVRATLEKDFHRVTAAEGGQAGIEAFLGARERGRPFAVVFTDLGMPHVDGLQVSRAVKAADPNTIVILLTGWGQRLVAEGEVPRDVDWVLAKPPTRSALRTALAQCLHKVAKPPAECASVAK